MSKMDELIGLFIEDEAANVDVYTRLFALEGLKLDCLDKLPLTVDSYYDIILEKNVDFLIIDFHLEKQVTYKGIDVLREIRKHDSTIYAVLLTNYELDDFADQFGDYDYELQKSEITSRYIELLKSINNKIPKLFDYYKKLAQSWMKKNNRGCHYGIYKKTTLGKLLKP